MKCITHTDMDGHCSGAIVAHFENHYNPEDYFEVDYNTDLSKIIANIDKNEIVYITDFSFTKPTAHFLKEIVDKTHNVVWADHHESSIVLQEDLEYSWMKNIAGIRSKDYSGAALIYMYLYNKDFCEIPLFVQYVSDFDNWNHKLKPYSTYFKFGMETIKDTTSVSATWRLLMSEANSNREKQLLKSLVSKGEIIQQYSEVEYENYCKDYSYVSEIDGYKCLVINRRGNSLLFGNHVNDYPVTMIWVYSGDRYNYSIYSSDPDVDCSKIAEKRGGGGHRGASGFILDDMPFIKTAEREF